MGLSVYEYLLLLGATVMMLLSLFCAIQNRDDGFSWFSKVIAVLQFGLRSAGCSCRGWHVARISLMDKVS